MVSTVDLFMVFVLFFFIISNIVVQVVEVVLNMLLMPRFGFKIRSVSLFGLTFLKQNGKWNAGFKRLSYLCQCDIINDISKPVSEDAEKKEKQATYLVSVTMLLVGLLAALGASDCFSRLFHGGTLSLEDILALSFVSGVLFHSCVHLAICVYTWKTIMKRLGGYTAAAVKKIRQGYSFGELSLKPLEGLAYENVSNTEKLMYYNLYIYYLVVVGQTGELRKISHEMTYLLENAEFVVQQTGLYYWLVYYYARYEKNPKWADKFLKKVWPVLSVDSDANAKRVLAYYYYGIQGDREKAGEYLREGLGCIESFSCGAERELERKLLEELAGELGIYTG